MPNICLVDIAGPNCKAKRLSSNFLIPACRHWFAIEADPTTLFRLMPMRGLGTLWQKRPYITAVADGFPQLYPDVPDARCASPVGLLTGANGAGKNQSFGSCFLSVPPQGRVLRRAAQDQVAAFDRLRAMGLCLNRTLPKATKGHPALV